MIGQELLHYRILGKIGRGNVGQVYRAEDTRLRRRVALKVVRGIQDDEQRLERFRKEAWTLASLNHPNVVTLYAVEYDEPTQTHFLTMELVEGNTLDALVVPGGLDLPTFRGIVLSLLRGMQAAHSKEIIHRDLKPQNVKITNEEELKILDFGLATQPKSEEELEDSLQGDEDPGIVGTVPYMAPETLHGRKGDARVDVFALGVMCYELLVGERPFLGSAPMAVAAAILREPTPSLRARRHDVSPELERIVMRCLAKDPDDRFADAGQVLHALRGLADWPSQTLSGDFSAWQDSEEMKKSLQQGSGTSNRSMLLAVAATAIAVPLLLFAILVGRDSDSKSPRAVRDAPSAVAQASEESTRTMLVVLPFDNQGEAVDDFFAQGVSDEITGRLTRVAGLGVISRASAARFASTEKSAQEIGEELDVEYILSGSVRWDHSVEPARVLINPRLTRVADQIEMWATQYERVLEDIFELQSNIAQDVVDQLGQGLLAPPPAVSPTQELEAYQAYLRGRHFQRSASFDASVRDQATTHFRRAVELDPSYVEAWAALAVAEAFEIHLGIDTSKARYRRAEEALSAARRLDPEHFEVRLAAAQVQYRAFKDYDRALEELMFLKDVESAEIQNLYGLIVRRQGRLEESLEALRRAEVLDPQNAFLMNEIGSNCLFLRRDECARSAFRRAIALDPGTANIYYTYVLHLWLQGDFDEARRYLASVPTSASGLDEYHWFWQEMYEGDYASAAQRMRKVGDAWFRIFYFTTPSPLLEAYAAEALGEKSRAQSAYARAEELTLEALKEKAEDPRLLGSLGLAQAGLGKKDAAIGSGLASVQRLSLARDAIYGPIRLLDLALIYARVGDLSAAQDQIDVLLSIPAPFTEVMLERDPRWALIRTSVN